MNARLDPSSDEHFYAHALAILVGPGRRIGMLMRAVNLLYWMSVIGSLGWLFGQVIDRGSPVAIHEASLVTSWVHPGDPVRVRYVFTRYRSCTSEVSWSIYDGADEVTLFGPVHSNAAGRPDEENVVRAWPTPVNAAPGQGRLRVIYAFACPGNYLHAIYPVVMILPDVLFTIRPNDQPGDPSGTPARPR